ncbi:hypothetical protein NZL82_01640 [Sphingomonas sanguinis]|uniref:phage head-tail joining protein n=1 Tax=Sphingomonas sp. LC-1 TaxID=3110957 RepID=UPI0021BA8A86|nr:hypothetical protein [Sphingomonas sp. LC-1]MCT8000574.1 hypothetical protein [Sphingomonas sp. LC-1]
MSMGYTEADRAKLRACMLEGVRETSMGGRRMVFHSIADMLALDQAISAELAATAAPVHRGPSAVQIVVDL